MILSKKIGAVILAAGSSSRLGRPKQLLTFQSKPMLQYVIDMVVPFQFIPTVLVLGAHSEEILKDTDPKKSVIVINQNWNEGIGSSIRLGVSEAIKMNDSLENILFLLADQPYVTTALIKQLADQHSDKKECITACRYNDSIGVPAIFSSDYFESLQSLRGDSGAKKIISQNIDKVKTILFRRGDVDIDTDEDYENLLKNFK